MMLLASWNTNTQGMASDDHSKELFRKNNTPSKNQVSIFLRKIPPYLGLFKKFQFWKVVMNFSTNPTLLWNLIPATL